MGERVREILETNFEGMEVSLEDLPDQRVTGSVVWAGFDGHDHVERQQIVRHALQDALELDLQQVGILLTYTPRELDVMMAA